MVDRLRALLEKPLDPSAARAVVVLASAILLGFAGLFVLAAGEDEEESARSAAPRSASPSPTSPPPAVQPTPAEAHPPLHGQDPQDREGSPAARRAERALRSHRALQHVPYRSGGLKVELVGARGHRALLRVSADTVEAARAGWRRFLRRYQDSGRAYIPIFQAGGGRDG